MAIELQSSSGVLENDGHLVRCATRLRYGNWSNDQQVLFRTVYLATNASLSHTRYFGPHFMNTEFEIHILLNDPLKFIASREHVLVYPVGAFVDIPKVRFKGAILGEQVAVLNPMKTPHKNLALLIPTIFSQDIVLTIGFDVSQNGLPVGKKLWKNIAPVSKNAPLEKVLQDTLRDSQHGAQEVLII